MSNNSPSATLEQGQFSKKPDKKKQKKESRKERYQREKAERLLNKTAPPTSDNNISYENGGLSE